MNAKGYLTEPEWKALVFFENDNLMEDDRNMRGSGPRTKRTSSFELDPKVAKAIQIGKKLNEKGSLAEDDLAFIVELPEPDVEGSVFNRTNRMRLSALLLMVCERIETEVFG